MIPARLLAELETLALRLGIAVRVEPFGESISESGGGLCRVRGQPLVLIDESLPLEDQIAILVTALGHFDLENVYVPPLVRARIESARGAGEPTGARHT